MDLILLTLKRKFLIKINQLKVVNNNKNFLQMIIFNLHITHFNFT